MSAYERPYPANADDQTYQNNLIINYLPQSLADDEFRRIFERIGPLTSTKIVRNRATQYSFGYGFVEYENAEDAVRAIDELNGMQLENKRIKVAFSRPPSDDTKRAKIMVKNLQDLSLETLNEIFSRFGTIVQSYITTSGIAFVLFDKREEAERAIHDLDGTLLPGASQPLEIKFAFAKNPRQHKNNLYQNNDYQPNQNFRPMRQYNNSYGNDANFTNSYGRPSNSRPPRYQQSGSDYGYDDAYNGRSSQSEAYGGPIRSSQYGSRPHYSNRYNPMSNPYGQQADSNGSSHSQYRSNAYGNSYGGHSNSANYSGQPRNYQQGGRFGGGDQTGGHQLFVFNVAHITNDDLNKLFSPFGPVLKATVIPNRGFGFVNMENQNDARNAIQSLNDTMLNDQKIQVSFKTGRRS